LSKSWTRARPPGAESIPYRSVAGQSIDLAVLCDTAGGSRRKIVSKETIHRGSYRGGTLEVRPVARFLDRSHRRPGGIEPLRDSGGDDLRREQRVIGTPNDKHRASEAAGALAGGIAVVPHVRHGPHNLCAEVRADRDKSFQFCFGSQWRHLPAKGQVLRGPELAQGSE